MLLCCVISGFSVGFRHLIFIATLLWCTSAADTRLFSEKFLLIREGMPRQEVVRILGAPPGYYAEGWEIVLPQNFRFPLGLNEKTETWSGRDGVVIIVFDAGDKTEAKAFERYYMLPRPIAISLDWILSMARR